MRKMLGVAVVMMVAGPALVLGQASETTEVLADMQAALGGADQLAAVRTLTAVGTVYRVTARGSDERGIERRTRIAATDRAASPWRRGDSHVRLRVRRPGDRSHAPRRLRLPGEAVSTLGSAADAAEGA